MKYVEAVVVKTSLLTNSNYPNIETSENANFFYSKKLFG